MLESVGSDSQEMLMAAQDKLAECINVRMRSKEDGNKEENKCIKAALYDKSVFNIGVGLRMTEYKTEMCTST